MFGKERCGVVIPGVMGRRALERSSGGVTPGG
jgi:hypothetical protein